jgi:hypothetical protein
MCSSVLCGRSMHTAVSHRDNNVDALHNNALSDAQPRTERVHRVSTIECISSVCFVVVGVF